MKKIAIIGGGISGLTAAYELEKRRRAGEDLDWHLYEASDRLGGTIETTRTDTTEGRFILEGGPDGWVTEKPWARDLAIELGLEDQLIQSNDATRKTYILQNGALQPIPDRMRLMVPEDLTALDASPLFSTTAKAAYAAEITRAAELRASAPIADESIATFVRRHFGNEVLTTLAAPLLSGIFGGDVETLSVRAVMPQFVAMEREHGSLIAALQSKPTSTTRKPIFTTLRNGIASLTEALVATLPKERIHHGHHAYDLDLDFEEWYIDFMAPEKRTFLRRLTNVIDYWDHVILAVPLDTVRRLLSEWDPSGTVFIRSDQSFLSLAPQQASSALLINFAWSAEAAANFTLPTGFGFLIPQSSALTPQQNPISLLAATFADQKFPHRAPPGAKVIRAYFGDAAFQTLTTATDAETAAAALTQLQTILGQLPAPSHTSVRRLPDSLPQYEVGHLDRIARLESLVATIPGLHLLGNSYRGVGLPDLIRDARATARSIPK